MSMISCLPIEMHFKIQAYFDRNSALNYSCTSHACHDLLFADSNAWKKIFPQVSFPASISPKKYLNLHAISSIYQLDEHFAQFAHKIALGQKGKFICIFPFNNNLTLRVNLKFKSKFRGFALINGSFEFSVIKPAKLGNLKETYIYMNALNTSLIIEKAIFNPKCSSYYEIDRSFPFMFISENSLQKKMSHSFFEDTVNRITNRELALKAEKFYNFSAKIEFLKLAAYITTIFLTFLLIKHTINTYLLK